MSTRDHKLAHDFRNIGPDKIKAIETLKSKGKYQNGYACNELIEPVPQYWSAPGEVVNFNKTGTEAAKNNCWIILGRDRVDYPHTGYGGRGDTQSAAIYICAGMSSADTSEVQDHNLETDLNNYPKNPQAAAQQLKYKKTVRSPFQDASIMYLSQKTDIDNMFHLGGCTEEERWKPESWDSSGWGSTAAGKMSLDRFMSITKYHVAKAPAPQAGVAIKSDNVRIVGRNSIRIQVKEEQLALGSKTNNSSGIALIGGGAPNACQPAVLGYNLISSYRHIKESMLVLQRTLDLFMKMQMNINMIISNHEHVNGPLGLTSQFIPFPMAIRQAMSSTEAIVGLSLSAFTGRMSTFVDNFCEPGDKYILSKNVFHD